VALLLAAAPVASAQRPLAPPPGASAPFLARVALPLARDSVKIPPTHWEEGAIIGGVAVGIFGAVLGVGLCNFDEPCHNSAVAAAAGLVLGGLVGVGVGAMIGGQFPKHPDH